MSMLLLCLSSMKSERAAFDAAAWILERVLVGCDHSCGSFARGVGARARRGRRVKRRAFLLR